jgi:hypothetical protein
MHTAEQTVPAREFSRQAGFQKPRSILAGRPVHLEADASGISSQQKIKSTATKCPMTKRAIVFKNS